MKVKLKPLIIKIIVRPGVRQTGSNTGLIFNVSGKPFITLVYARKCITKRGVYSHFSLFNSQYTAGLYVKYSDYINNKVTPNIYGNLVMK